MCLTQAATRKLLEQFKTEEGSLKLLDNQIGQIGQGSSTETEDVSKYKRSAHNERNTTRTGGMNTRDSNFHKFIALTWCVFQAVGVL